jgi:putative phosphoserine phosphatase/1-acylglycerol-3-phosphate O-acyltransferase
VFNHQSAVDALIISRLLRKDFTGLAKSEMKANPLLGPVLSFADVVFIDRDKPGADAIQPAIEKLKAGISIAVAPEGRRSNGRRLGMFRRGAFNIAMQAGVPVIPIVIENASDSLPRSSLLIRGARVRVRVLKPISTRSWKPATLDKHVNHCREAFLKVLGQEGDGQIKKRVGRATE